MRTGLDRVGDYIRNEIATGNIPGAILIQQDPRDDMFAICMMQTPSQRGRIQTELKGRIYAAMGR